MNKELKKILRIIIILILIFINVFILRKNLVNSKIKESEKSNSIKAKPNEQENITSSEIDSNKNTTISNITTTNLNETTIISDEKAVIENKISSMNESNRAQTYFGEFIDDLENKDYSNAYNMLNDEYKKSYFQTQRDFEQYIETSYPKGTLAVTYNDYDRKGDLFILDVTIYSVTDTNANKLNQTVVIRENGLNNFKISINKFKSKYNKN